VTAGQSPQQWWRGQRPVGHPAGRAGEVAQRDVWAAVPVSRTFPLVTCCGASVSKDRVARERLGLADLRNSGPTRSPGGPRTEPGGRLTRVACMPIWQAGSRREPARAAASMASAALFDGLIFGRFGGRPQQSAIKDGGVGNWRGHGAGTIGQEATPMANITPRGAPSKKFAQLPEGTGAIRRSAPAAPASYQGRNPKLIAPSLSTGSC